MTYTIVAGILMAETLTLVAVSALWLITSDRG